MQHIASSWVGSSVSGMTPVAAAVAGLVRRRGPIPFDEVMDVALYDPEVGFYSSADRGAGRRRDFITSPEVGPLFGAVVARALGAWWRELGEPDPFVVVEAGAGPGTLARTVLAAAPGCAAALRYVLVDRSEGQRYNQRAHLSLAEPSQALAPAAAGQDDDASRTPTGGGPVVVSLPDLPRVDAHVVLANELLDNLPTRIFERTGTGWAEVCVGLDGDEVALVEILVPTAAEIAGAADAPVGARVPWQEAATGWLRAALATVRRGRVVAFDYASTTTELGSRPIGEWLRTYAAHGRGAHPLDDLGLQDITCEVAIDQLAAVAAPATNVDQAAWLAAHGLDDLVDEGRRVWRERAAIGDLEAIGARSRVSEAEALTDPAGLGAFRVLEWLVP